MRTAIATAALAAALTLTATPAAHATPKAVLPVVFADGFELPIKPLFPLVDGKYQLPSGPVSTQIDWVLSELQTGETTTLAEVNAHFHPSFVAQVPAQELANFVNSLRTTYRDAVIEDLIMATPLRLTAIIKSPANSNLGFMQFGTRHGSGGKIVQLGVSPYSGSVQYPADQTRTMAQAVTHFGTLASENSMLVAELDDFGQCIPIAQLNPSTPRATGSIFKTWILGALAVEVGAGAMSPSQTIALSPQHFAQGGILQVEPVGTPFTVRDAAALMMGISDNTATDMLHQTIGRAKIDAMVEASGMADSSILTPLLGISEQFHLFYSFPLAQSQSYVNGTDAFQRQFITDNIAPLGPLTGGPFPYFHPQLLTEGSWRASPMDICNLLSTLHAMDDPAFDVVDRALGAGVALPGVRTTWARAWFKGGSLASAANANHVYTYAWLLQRNFEQPYVVVLMANNPQPATIDVFDLQSIAARILDLTADL